MVTAKYILHNLHKCSYNSLSADLYAVAKLFGEGNGQLPVAGGALLVQDVVHHHRPADDHHPQQEVDRLQGAVVGVQVDDAVEVEGDLEQELGS